MNEDRFGLLKQAIAEHPGTVATVRWGRLRRAHVVFVGNLRDLNQLLEAPARDPDLALALTQNDHESKGTQSWFFDEFDRRLHNFAAAVGTLIAQARRVTSKYTGTDFVAEYSRRLQSVLSTPAAPFVGDLRDYVLHDRFPEPRNEASISSSAITYRQLVSVEALLRSKKNWSSGAKQYLAVQGEFLDIRQAIDEYVQALDGFYGWMFGQFDQLHGAEVGAADALISEYNNARFGMSA